MKYILSLTGIILLGYLILFASKDKPLKAANNQDHPNIIFIFIDDMGYSDLSYCKIATPNIDRIAKEGIMFTNFYVASPICSPSRVGVLTGQYPSRHRITSFLASSKRNANRGMVNYLDPEAPSIAKTMKEAGYRTGKWHMGGGRDVGDAPQPQGLWF